MKYYTAAEVAEIMQRDKRTVLKWIKEGVIYAEKQANNPQWLIEAREVKRLQRERSR